MIKVYCSIDTTDINLATRLAQQVSEVGCGVKLGLEFFSVYGADGIKKISDACPNAKIFLDLKFHDIPNTVAGALRGVACLGIAYVNCHASGGVEMMKAGQNALAEESTRLGLLIPKFLAVTVLTSLDENALNDVGQMGPAETQVVRLAKLTQQAGLSGIVCSGQEIKLVRGALGQDFVLMVPGIRPAGADLGDQKRVMTPRQAMEAGATHLVIGRPITGAKDPAQAASDILAAL